jgi:hypothetical protein
VRSDALDDDALEGMLAACLAALDDDAQAQRYSAWEVSFLESIEDAADEAHLTPRQARKLAQIYQQRVLDEEEAPWS